MLLVEKVAYLKGLLSGLDLQKDTKEEKIYTAIFSVLDELSSKVLELEESRDELEELVDILDQDLGSLEEDFYEEDIEEEEEEDEENDDDDESSFDDEIEDDITEEDEDVYEITCPSCNDCIYVNESILDDGNMNCPNCNEELEFDINN
ncbi:MAG: hypothetical protein KFW09_03050 [Oscillospiraceae bacterium]|nr:hypothetical protein [Oscillospiraceae bacterium]